MKRGTKIAVAVIAETFFFVVVIALLQLDKIVNGTLYNYGLKYNYEWFFEYKIFWSIAIIFIAVLVFVIPLVVMTQLDEQQ